MLRVLLITMPFSFANAPSLSLSLLKGALQRGGFPCDIRYLQLPFARRIGKEIYYRIAQYAPRTLVGEWLFAHHLFGFEQLPPAQEYIERLLLKEEWAFDENFAAQLPALRLLTDDYLQECFGGVDWKCYDVIGFTSTFAQNLASLALAQRIKAAYPEKIIVFGGANCEDEMGEEMHRRFPFIDYICSGESDLLFPLLLQRIQAGRSTSQPPQDVHLFGDLTGLVYRSNGETVANSKFTSDAQPSGNYIPDIYAPPVFDLDELPLPDFDDYFVQLAESGLELAPGELQLPIETSRGCWWGAKSHCTFCGLNDDTMVFRSKSAARVLEEFTYLAQRYPEVKRVDAVDKIMDMRYFKDVIPGLIEAKLGLNIFYFVKANLTREQVHLLQQAGVRRIQPGIESLDTGVLQLMRKGCTTIQNVQLLKWASETGLEAIWNFITGFPGEDPLAYRRMAEMIPTLRHLQPPAGESGMVRLDRFSPYFENPAAFGMLNIRPSTAYRYVYPFPDDSLRRLAYFFDFDYADGRDPRLYTRQLDEAVAEWYGPHVPGALLSLHSAEWLRIYDSRPGVLESQIELQGTVRTIYEFCEQGRTLEAIAQCLEKKALSRDGEMVTLDEIRQLLDWLMERRLMLYADERYLSLAIPMDQAAQAFIEAFVEHIEAGSLESSLPASTTVP